jgi:hypothetical protein
MNFENDIIAEQENEIFATDTLDKLYKLFETIDETMIYNLKKICSYKSICDDTNVFIMIDRKTLQKILEKIPRPKKRCKKSNKE